MLSALFASMGCGPVVRTILDVFVAALRFGGAVKREGSRNSLQDWYCSTSWAKADSETAHARIRVIEEFKAYSTLEPQKTTVGFQNDRGTDFSSTVSE